jgi:predicted acylesterase/phospholipase RssA
MTETNKDHPKIDGGSRGKGPIEITTVEDFERYWYGDDTVVDSKDGGRHSDGSSSFQQQQRRRQQQQRDYVSLLRRLSVKGDTQIIGSKDHPDVVHPVVQLLHERRRKQLLHNNKQRQEQRQQQEEEEEEKQMEENKFHPADVSSSNNITAKISSTLHNDGNKVALVVEGGGMRGCVSAGMICAVHYLGLEDTLDVVYGSSAGAVVAAYFCSRQLPWFGPEVYYDQLTTAGDKFIDLKRLLRSLGFGLADPRLIKDVLVRPDNGKPLLNLRYLLEVTMQTSKPLDWQAFQERQAVQPLKVVATGLNSQRPFVLSQESGHFDSLEELSYALHASCLLPGIAGPVMNVLKDPKKYHSTQHKDAKPPTFYLKNGFHQDDTGKNDYEPLGDAILSSPIPYDLAHQEGATHVVVLRSSPDGTNVMAGTSAKSIWESLIFRRFFLRKNHLPGMYQRLKHDQQHQRIYATSILELNARAAEALRPRKSNKKQQQQQQQQHTMTIALEPGTEEVTHLETSREAIFEGVRRGFARAFDALVEDPTLRGQGYRVAQEYFPDEILDYDPKEILALQEEKGKIDYQSAFETYLESEEVSPKAWKGKSAASWTRHIA